MNLSTKQQQFLDAVLAGHNIFLEGKAGTGKSTVTKLAMQALKEAGKKVAAVAPTGVAANNVGGQTIHSLFGIPPFGVLDFQSCNFIGSEKRRVLDAIDVLFIDEVSMLRPDLLDGIHWTLLKNKCKGLHRKQVIFVGDFKQLPPVLNDTTLTMLRKAYKGERMQHAAVFQKLNVLSIELDEVLRQSNPDFVDALNMCREGQKTEYFRQFAGRDVRGPVTCPDPGRIENTCLTYIKLKTMTQDVAVAKAVDTKGQELINEVASHIYVPVITPERLTNLKALASTHAVITTKAARESAEEFLKMAKKEHKSQSDNRLTYTRKVAELVAYVSAPEKELEDALKPVEKEINAQLRREAEEIRLQQEKIAREAREKEEAERKENERKAQLQTGVARLKTEPIAKMEMAATLVEFNVIVATLEKMDCKTLYGEFSEEADLHRKAALAAAPELKATLEARLKAARENAEEAARQEAERRAKQAEMERQQQEEKERIAEEYRQADMQAAAAADMQRQAQSQAVGSLTGTKTVWNYEVVDLNLIPRQFFVLDEKLIRQAIKDGERDIAGLKIFSDVARTGK